MKKIDTKLRHLLSERIEAITPRVASWRKIIGGIGIAISLLLCFGFVGGYERNLISSWPLWLSGAGLLFSAWFGGYLEE